MTAVKQNRPNISSGDPIMMGKLTCGKETQNTRFNFQNPLTSDEVIAKSSAPCFGTVVKNVVPNLLQ